MFIKVFLCSHHLKKVKLLEVNEVHFSFSFWQSMEFSFQFFCIQMKGGEEKLREVVYIWHNKRKFTEYKKHTTTVCVCLSVFLCIYVEEIKSGKKIFMQKFFSNWNCLWAHVHLLANCSEFLTVDSFKHFTPQIIFNQYDSEIITSVFSKKMVEQLLKKKLRYIDEKTLNIK